jgi:uncharacterized membrane protein
MDSPVVHVILEILFCTEKSRRKSTLLQVQSLAQHYVGRLLSSTSHYDFLLSEMCYKYQCGCFQLPSMIQTKIVSAALIGILQTIIYLGLDVLLPPKMDNHYF